MSNLTLIINTSNVNGDNYKEIKYVYSCAQTHSNMLNSTSTKKVNVFLKGFYKNCTFLKKNKKTTLLVYCTLLQNHLKVHHPAPSFHRCQQAVPDYTADNIFYTFFSHRDPEMVEKVFLGFFFFFRLTILGDI